VTIRNIIVVAGLAAKDHTRIIHTYPQRRGADCRTFAPFAIGSASGQGAPVGTAIWGRTHALRITTARIPSLH